ncbi:hypothetical protein Q3G72_016923 [Acer saccharum]|nr:hypothetical protein Q3G72_016923 [Acer saccharum]
MLYAKKFIHPVSENYLTNPPFQSSVSWPTFMIGFQGDLYMLLVVEAVDANSIAELMSEPGHQLATKSRNLKLRISNGNMLTFVFLWTPKFVIQLNLNSISVVMLEFRLDIFSTLVYNMMQNCISNIPYMSNRAYVVKDSTSIVILALDYGRTAYAVKDSTSIVLLALDFGRTGTSRLAHYHVLWDENKFTVPSTFYAHLATFRACFYMEPETSDSGSMISGTVLGCGGRVDPEAIAFGDLGFVFIPLFAFKVVYERA